ncbi:hypothetical protein [Domibacillus aminovorans]|uniref:hypothetical protein n=1 Tax=Domibacillus aminovorans TaxID=29332 RepID=UPI001FD5644C|nr:hypothetical protein [Domibacillus aminovorans]
MRWKSPSCCMSTRIRFPPKSRNSIRGVKALLHRGSSPGKPPLLSPDQEAEVKRMIEHSTPAEEGHGCESSWDTRILKHVLDENPLLR